MLRYVGGRHVKSTNVRLEDSDLPGRPLTRSAVTVTWTRVLDTANIPGIPGTPCTIPVLAFSQLSNHAVMEYGHAAMLETPD